MLEQTVTQRNVAQLKEAWKSMYSQLLDYRAWDTGPSSSLFGTEATPSLQVGPRQKKFAQVGWSTSHVRHIVLFPSLVCVGGARE